MKYAALGAFLAAQKADRIEMTFTQVAEAAKIKLPQSAFRYAQWWENDGLHHVQAKAWLGAGYRTEGVDLIKRTVVFARIEGRAQGVREMPEAFEPRREKVSRHPMIGAMKGTFTISPGWDVTKPAFDEDDVAEWEARLEQKWKLIEEGLRGKRP